MTARRGRLWKRILAAAAAAALVAALGSTVTEIGPWYRSLDKPAWQPPDWLFGPVWTLIYATTSTAGVIAWRQASNSTTRDWLIALFALNGFLNILWSFLFFRMLRPDLALFEVAFLWLSIVALIVLSATVSKLSAWLLAPYLVWVSFAAMLNLAIVRLNYPF